MASSADERDVDVGFPAEDDLRASHRGLQPSCAPLGRRAAPGPRRQSHAQEVIVDFGYKLEGLVPIEQLRQPDGTVPFKAGDTIDVMIDRHGPQPEGYVLLSYSKASQAAHLGHAGARHARAAADLGPRDRTHQGRIDGGRGRARVHARIAGGCAARRTIWISWWGRIFRSRFIKLNRRRGNVVVSRKMALEEDLKARKANALEHLFEGAVVPGVVKNLTEYGAFVDLGGIDGLLHVSDMSHGRVRHPSEVVHVGEEITVKVLKFDREKERISLGIRQLRRIPGRRCRTAIRRAAA